MTGEAFVEALATLMTAQDPLGASVTTTHSGTITVDVDDVMNPTNITFVSANIIAANSGNWLPQEGGGDGGDPNVGGDGNPGTPMPANYGWVLDLGGPSVLVFYVASRDAIFSLNSESRSIASGQFDPLGIGLSVTQNWGDLNISSETFVPELEGGVREDLAGDTATNCEHHSDPGSNSCGSAMGSYMVSGNTATLTLPLSFHLGGGTPVVQLTGTLTATASLVAELQGDYNGDGIVNAADYTVWRDGGSPDDSQAGYDLWKANFGTSGSGSGSAAVPEPAGVALGLVGLLSLWFGRRGLN
jgi:hypothetical protein